MFMRASDRMMLSGWSTGCCSIPTRSRSSSAAARLCTPPRQLPRPPPPLSCRVRGPMISRPWCVRERQGSGAGTNASLAMSRESRPKNAPSRCLRRWTWQRCPCASPQRWQRPSCLSGKRSGCSSTPPAPLRARSCYPSGTWKRIAVRKKQQRRSGSDSSVDAGEGVIRLSLGTVPPF